jgi:hypothetical protein
MTPEQNRMRGKIANIHRNNPNDPNAADDLRRQLRESRLADHIRKVVDEAPPLTREQRDRLSLLLGGGEAA